MRSPSSGPTAYDPKDLTLSLSYDLQRAAVRGARQAARRGRHARSARPARCWRSPRRRPTTRRRSPTRTTAKTTFEALQADQAQPLLPRATLGRYVPGSVFKIVTAVAGLGSGAITPETTYKQQPAAEKDGLLVDGFRVRDGHHPATGSTALDLRRRDRGLVQHLLRADRPADRRRGPRRLRRPDGLRRGDPVRPADGRVAGDQRRRQGAGRLQRRRRAGQRRLRPGRDVRHAAPDGARRRDRRQRRGAHAAAPGDVDLQRARAARGRSGRARWAGSSRRPTPQAINAAMVQAVEGDARPAVHDRGEGARA